MTSPDAPTDTTAEPVGLDRAEAALVEHYPRLVRLGFLVLPGTLGQQRRVLTAHAIAQRALPRGSSERDTPPALPAQRAGTDAGYAYLRLQVLRAALDAARARRRLPRPPWALPQVLGLRLLPSAGGPQDVALDQRLAELAPAGRAAYALRRVDGLDEQATRRLLAAAGVPDEECTAAVEDAAGLAASVEPADPCFLQARPTDLLRRRRLAKGALFGGAALALLVAGGLTLLPEGWGPDGAAAPSYSRNEAAESALDPQALRRIPADTWQRSARLDFSVWPARGGAVDDTGLLRRALAVWARPGEDVEVTATPGTQTGPAPGPAQLLYAGETGGTSVVLLHDGLRLVRYAERVGADGGHVVLDFARVDGADLVSSAAVVVGRGDGNVRYLLAPWITEVGTVDLLDPSGTTEELAVDEDGVTGALRSASGGSGQQPGQCASFSALAVTPRGVAEPYLMADLGELAPAVLTGGAPGEPHNWTGSADARAQWARMACQLPLVGGAGVRSLNAWHFAEQSLPDGGGTADWVCLRADTWRGTGSRSLAFFMPPAERAAEPASVTASAEDSASCGERQPEVLSGVLWHSPADDWHLVAAASEGVTGIVADGAVSGEGTGRTLTLPAEEGARAVLTARLPSGDELRMLGS
ncbi:hypothetical protein E1265_21675 [Streptomyces sp. 8K308]|uniref:hypothetical protein n=1 Tax=Streptomyces sp. 8K308 TaxID=2530388 RepID=UPI001052DA99|nr:hypothetical protein [Streptomyces sp. 8K308]TDC20545.1 hypothetical protein E1265_21675 [Streptomyces sp. 8K308]